MGAIKAERLDRRVTVLAMSAGSDDGYGAEPGDWAEVGGAGNGTRWASVKPRMGREAAEAAGREGRTVMSFWFRYDELTSTITAAHALQLDGQRYGIIAPPIEVGRRDGIEVLAVAGGVDQ